MSLLQDIEQLQDELKTLSLWSYVKVLIGKNKWSLKVILTDVFLLSAFDALNKCHDSLFANPVDS